MWSARVKSSFRGNSSNLHSHNITTDWALLGSLPCSRRLNLAPNRGPRSTRIRVHFQPNVHSRVCGQIQRSVRIVSAMRLRSVYSLEELTARRWQPAGPRPNVDRDHAWVFHGPVVIPERILDIEHIIVLHLPTNGGTIPIIHQLGEHRVCLPSKPVQCPVRAPAWVDTWKIAAAARVGGAGYVNEGRTV